jgi:hypothetical protein
LNYLRQWAVELGVEQKLERLLAGEFKPKHT